LKWWFGGEGKVGENEMRCKKARDMKAWYALRIMEKK